MAAYCGFTEEDYDEVFIILDKMDKIGRDGVAAELMEMGYARENVDTYLGLFDEVTPDVSGHPLSEGETGRLFERVRPQMAWRQIISSVEAAKEAEFGIRVRPDAGERAVLLYRNHF